MDDDMESLRAQFVRLRDARGRLAEVVAAYRVVRASRFARIADVTLAAKRVLRRLNEPPTLAVLDLPALPASLTE